MPLPKAIHRTQAWYRRLTVPQFTVVTGLLVISLGTLLLASPLCSSQSVGLWEALFTATSAVTVTGLTVIDVGKDLTTFGQAVLALMILVGGLGLMAITTFKASWCAVPRSADVLTAVRPLTNSVWAAWAAPSGALHSQQRC